MTVRSILRALRRRATNRPISCPPPVVEDDVSSIETAKQRRSDLDAIAACIRWSRHGRPYVGRYRIQRRIGGGGMGTVFRAYDPELDRSVALKVLNPALPTRGHARLMREARAMARINHPNIVSIHDMATIDGRVVLSMELVDGVDLQTWLEERTPSWQEILRVFREAGRGLAAAHRAGVLHRDFKPSNVLIGHDGRVLVADFGVARNQRASESFGEQSTVSKIAEPSDLTPIGGFVGTPRYAAPEQLVGCEVDARADQFSFCVALHLALYGEFPLESLSVLGIRAAAKRPRRWGIPARLRRTLERGLRLEPAERFDSMEALLRSLPVEIRRPRRSMYMLGASIGLLASLQLEAMDADLVSSPARRPQVADVRAPFDSGRDPENAPTYDELLECPRADSQSLLPVTIGAGRCRATEFETVPDASADPNDDVHARTCGDGR